jgi:RNA polymerase sigma factor for flagellar operon FliA
VQPAITRPLATNASGASGTGELEIERLSVDELVTSNLALVGHLTREAAARLPRHLDSDDLMGAGALALVQAAQSFDPTLGVPFARFASTRVRGAMIDHMRQRDWASRSVRARSRAIAEVAETLTAALHRAPTDAELASASTLSEAEIREVRSGADRATVLSLDATVADSEGPIGRLTDAAPRPDEALVAAERMGYLRDAIAELPERQREVVTRYYLDQDQLTEIAEDLGVTQSRASQLRSEGLDLLREALTELLHDEARVGGGRAAVERAAGTGNSVQDGVRARRRAGYVAAVAARSSVHERADVSSYLAGAPLTRSL